MQLTESEQRAAALQKELDELKSKHQASSQSTADLSGQLTAVTAANIELEDKVSSLQEKVYPWGNAGNNREAHVLCPLFSLRLRTKQRPVPEHNWPISSHSWPSNRYAYLHVSLCWFAPP